MNITSQETGNIITAGRKRLESFDYQDGKIEVVYKIAPEVSTWPERPERAVKEIYEAVDGQIRKTGEVKGRVIPPRPVPEKIEWED